jgi:hypothetical protein
VQIKGNLLSKKFIHFQKQHSFRDQVPMFGQKAADKAFWRVWYLATVWVCMGRGELLKQLYRRFPNLRMLLTMIISRSNYFHTKSNNFPNLCHYFFQFNFF